MKSINIKSLIISILFLFLIFLVYFSLFKYQYIYPSGGDAAYHITLVDFILNNGYLKQEYTQGMHIFLAILALFIGTDAINIVMYFAPFLLILCFLSIFVLVRYIFGFKTALLVVIISALISSHPNWIWSDGTFADIISAEFLMFVFFYLFLKLIHSGKLGYCFSAAIIFISLHIFHLLSFLYALLILGLFTVIFIIYHFVKNKKPKFLKNILIFYLLIIVLAIIPAWFWYLGDYFAPILFSTIKSTITTGEISSSSQVQGINIQKVPSFSELKDMIGFDLLVFAFLSLFFIPKLVAKKTIIFLFCLSWLSVFILGSTTHFSPDPIRVIRELALIINIFSAFFIISFLKYLKNNKLCQIISIVAFSILLFINVPKGIDKYLAYKSQLLRGDNSTVEWLKNNTSDGSTILLSPSMGEEVRKGPFDLLLNDKKTIFTSLDSPFVQDPSSKIAKNYLKNNQIAYIYYRNAPIGWFPQQYNWKFGDSLEYLNYVENVYEMQDGDIKIIVYKVNQDLLF